MRIHTIPTVGIAGWLFADMLLAFALVVLGTEPSTPKPRPSTTPTPSPVPHGLERTFVPVTFSVSPSDAAGHRPAAVRAIRKAVLKHPRLTGRRAGMVITFGAMNNGAEQGEKLAAEINALLPRSDPALFAGATTRNFHMLSEPTGSVELDIYLFTTS